MQVNSHSTLSGDEQGLIGYYPMTEGKGTLTEDKARGANLQMNGCSWTMPEGIAVQFDGVNDYLQLDASSYAVTKENDYTLEFWFKAEEGQTNATMFSNGRGDGQDFGGSDGNIAIGFNEAGLLTFTNNGIVIPLEGNYRDNNWHHLAVAVSRTLDRGQIYIDGTLSTYFDATNIGGVESAYMYLGARGYTQANNTFVIDNFFKGKLDDFRFWNLYKNEKLVAENDNVKLDGTELGLIHYYPFEEYQTSQGQSYLMFSNKDKHISNTVNPETDKATLVGMTQTELESTDAAPLKNKGAVSNLEFEFVVNDDALIITLTEPEDKIAKTIVTFAVYDVRDINGNSIASPITWSAYIDRNQLKWGETELNLSKPVYEPLEFTVKAVNKGGSIQNYTISNMPSWLTVSSTSGSIDPSSSKNIVFTVDEGLNVGIYNEIAYLTNENGVSEALEINLTVAGEKPQWTVNPTDYKYNMNIFGKMRFNNIYSSDKGDMLAAFQNGKCIGVTTSTYNKNFDMWYALLTVYSNDIKANGIEYRMWDASTGLEYKATLSQEINFVNDAVIGDVDNPVIFDGQLYMYRNIELSQGWNWTSFNLTNSNMSDLNQALANGTWTSGDLIKNFNSFADYSTKNSGWGELKPTLSNKSMYMLYTANAQKLSVSGTAVDIKNTPITVNGRAWTYLGYLPPVNYTVKEALAGYAAQKGDIIKSQTGFAMFSRNEWVGNLAYLEANKGYMLLRTASDTVSFVYPATSGTLGSVKKTMVTETETLSQNYPENMSVIATTAGLEKGDRILAYVDGVLRSTGEYVNDGKQSMSFISIPGNENGATINFGLQRNGNIVASSTKLQYASNAVQGSVEDPVVLEFENANNSISVNPNPFDTEINIKAIVDDGDVVSVKISDITGRPIVFLNDQTVSGTVYQTKIAASTFEVGMYLVSVTVNGNISTYKATKK